MTEERKIAGWLDRPSITFTAFFFTCHLNNLSRALPIVDRSYCPAASSSDPGCLTKPLTKSLPGGNYKGHFSTESHPHSSLHPQPLITLQAHICFWGFLSLFSRVARSVPVCMFMWLNLHLNQSFNTRQGPSKLEGEENWQCCFNRSTHQVLHKQRQSKVILHSGCEGAEHLSRHVSGLLLFAV